MASTVAVRGHVAPGFEPVSEELQRQFSDGWHVGAGFAAYFNGVKVVDIQAGDSRQADETTGIEAKPFDDSTLTFVASCTKFVESVVVAYLVDQGVLSYDAPIAQYWPQFAQNDKGHITVGQLMQHRAGIPVLDQKLGAKLLVDDLEGLSAVLAAQKLSWEVPPDDQVDPAPKQAYHGITRGLYANEVCKRVDPKGRDIGIILQEDILSKIDAEFYIGLPDELLASERLATNVIGPAALVMHRLGLVPELPEEMKKLVGDETVNFSDYELAFLKDLFTDPSSWPSRSLTLLDMQPQDAKTNVFGLSDFVLKACLPSSNGVTNAASLAAMAELVRNSGRLGDVQVFSSRGAATIAESLQLAESYSPDLIMGTPIHFTRGGFARFLAEDDDKSECWGWGGAGGSMVRLCHSKGVACAFTMNKLGPRMAMNDPRGNRLFAATLNCASDSA